MTTEHQLNSVIDQLVALRDSLSIEDLQKSLLKLEENKSKAFRAVVDGGDVKLHVQIHVDGKPLLYGAVPLSLENTGKNLPDAAGFVNSWLHMTGLNRTDQF